MKIGKITYGSQSSNEFGLIVAGAGTFNPALPDIASYSVPGKNGDVIQDNHRYKNIDVKYPGFIADAFIGNAQGIRNWILSGKEYKELTDNFDTTHFRLAIGKDVSFSPVNENKAANMSITFNCKPQRFLTSGKTASAITNGMTMSNPTDFEALPLITFAGFSSSASISVTNSLGTFTMTTTVARTGSGTIDCDIQNIFSGNNSLNSMFTGDFFILAPGSNTFAISGFISPEITPRWWEL